jgi:acetyl esterase/lipase
MALRHARVAAAGVTAALLVSTNMTGGTAHSAAANVAAGSSAVTTTSAGWNFPIQKAGPSSVKKGVKKRTFRYWDDYGNATTLDVYMPRDYVSKRGAKLPTVVLVHGGAWTLGDSSSVGPQANQLARKGFVAVAPNYRLATEARWPAQRIDVTRAVTFIRKNAAFFNVDRNRMAILGSSAGGQIAAAVATHGDGKKRFKGLVVLSGLLNPLSIAQNVPTYSDSVVQDKLIGCDPSECADRYLDAIPALSLNRSDAPSLLFHSRDEHPFGTGQAREFVTLSRAVGVPAKLKILKGHQHGIEYWKRVNKTIFAWLNDRFA